MPTFTSNPGFLRYAEDEYLSELLLRAVKPRPAAKAPKTVTFEWGLSTGERTLQMYLVTAEGVTEWSLDGTWDKHAVVELALPKPKRGILIEQKVPGTLRLACARITIERGPRKRYSPPPAIDPSTYLVWGAREVTWNQLRAWLAVPPALKLYDQTSKVVPLDPTTFDEPIRAPTFGMTRVQRTAREAEPWMFISWGLAVGMAGHYLSVHRGTCDDAAWARALTLPAHLGPSTILSGTLRCTSDAWLRDHAAAITTGRAAGAAARARR